MKEINEGQTRNQIDKKFNHSRFGVIFAGSTKINARLSHFLTAIRLPHCQLWAITKRAASLT